MPYNGTGTFNLTYNWENDAANGIDITASRFDTQEGDIAANGLSICVTRDGQGVPTADIPWGSHKITGLANGTNAQDAAAYGQLTGALGSLVTFKGGLTLSTAGSSGTFGISVGAASDSANVLLLSLPSAFTKTTGTFSAGTGNGALDAGSIANNTWYHVFIIGSPVVSSDILFSLSPTAPTLPGGFTLFRWIGAMKTDGSAHWIAFSQKDGEFLWSIPIEDLTSTMPSNSSAQLLVLSVPTGIQVSSLFSMRGSYGSTVDFTLITSPDQADTASSGTQFTFFNSTAAVEAFQPLNIRTDTSGRIRVRSIQSGGGSPTLTLSIFTRGWTTSF